MARAGLSTLISRLRAMTNAGTSDATVAGTTYFSDDHLQDILDTTQTLWQRIPLIPRPELIDAEVVHIEYFVPDFIPRQFEQNAVDSGWFIRRADGLTIDPADYTPNYEAGHITFDTDTAGASYTLSCRTYNLHRAASNIWQQKAAFVYADTNWQADNHRLDSAQVFDHCHKMANYHAQLAGMLVSRLIRTDSA
jgi:hypothetical protein